MKLKDVFHLARSSVLNTEYNYVRLSFDYNRCISDCLHFLRSADVFLLRFLSVTIIYLYSVVFCSSKGLRNHKVYLTARCSTPSTNDPQPFCLLRRFSKFNSPINLVNDPFNCVILSLNRLVV